MSWLGDLAGSAGQTAQMVGYPESANGMTDFGTNTNLGQVQGGGSGFLGGLFNNMSAPQGGMGHAGSVLGQLLGSGLDQSQLGSLLHYGLQSYLQTGQFPTLQSTIKNLVGPMGQVPQGGQAGGISSILGGYTGGIIGGHGGA